MINSLYILPTNYCTLKCAHCAVNSAPTNEKKALSLDMIKNLLDNSANFKIAVISGGGEPMTLDKEYLVQLIRMLKSKGLYVKLTTNGYWGRTCDDAAAGIECLKNAGVDQLTVSVTTSHLQFVSYANLHNITYHANKNGLKLVLQLTEENQYSELKKNVIDSFVKKRISVPYLYGDYYYIPLGRAAESYACDDFYIKNMEGCIKRCDSIQRNICIHPDGNVTPCAMVGVNSIPLLIAGNINNQCFHAILDTINRNELFKFLGSQGIIALKQRVESVYKIKIDSDYVNCCHACYAILNRYKNECMHVMNM